jgi:hypothetical protein
MTVNTTPVETNYTGNASTTVFALTFAFAANAHVKVYLGGVLQGSGYSITGAGNPSGGTLTFSAAPGSGVAIKARRVTPLTQEIDVVNNATVFASSLETGLDYALMRQQEEAFDRAALGVSVAADAVQTAADRVQTGLDATATAADRVQTGLDRVATAADRVQTGLDRVQTGADVVSATAVLASAALKANNLSDLASASAARTNLAVVGTADLAASTGAALVKCIQTGAGAVARTVQDKLRTIVTPEDFGAVGDGVADDTAAIQAAMDAADEVVGKDSAIYSVTNIQHRSDKTFRGNCEIKQRTAGSPTWFFDGTTARIERARLLGPHFRGHASSTVQCVRMEESGGFAILGAEVDIQGTGGYHTLKIVCTGANAVYGCRITVLQHSSLNTGCVLSGVYNVYDLFISDAANGLAYDDTGAHSLFTRAISNCGQQSSATNSVWNKVTVEGWVGTGKDNALQFTGSNPSINNASIVNVPAATTPGGIGLNVGGASYFAIRGLRIFGTDYPLYPIDLRANAGGLIENTSVVGGFKLEQYHTAAEMRSLTFVGSCATVSAYGARLFGTATYDPANLVDGAGATTTVTVTGAALGDFAEATFSLDLQGITLTAWVSAADTVSVRFQNETGGTIDLASGTILARARKT